MAERVYTKFIPCPDHPSGRVHWWDLRRHKAILFCHPGQWAGIWECPVTGSSESHEHTDYEIETGEDWPTSPESTMVNTYEVYICGGELGCGVQIEDADPAVDRHDAMVDAEIDDYRDRELETAI